MGYIKDNYNKICEMMLDALSTNEAFKDANSLHDHYNNHVLCAVDKNEYWDERGNICTDGKYRVKMPPMTEDEYSEDAHELMNEKVYGGIDDYRSPVIGFKSYSLKYMADNSGVFNDKTQYKNAQGKDLGVVHVKIRKHSDYTIFKEDLDDDMIDKYGYRDQKLFRFPEVVVYVIKDGVKYIYSYMLAKNLAYILKDFDYIGPLAKNESLKGSPAEMLLAMDDLEN